MNNTCLQTVPPLPRPGRGCWRAARRARDFFRASGGCTRKSPATSENGEAKETLKPGGDAAPVSSAAQAFTRRDPGISFRTCESGFHTPLRAYGSSSSSDAPSQPDGGQIRQRLPLIIALVKEKSHTEVGSNPSSLSFGPFKNTVLFTWPQGVKWGYKPALLKYLISRTIRALNAKGCLNQGHSLCLL
uniref:Uncharacterized protein n=1 Tax=Calidris pygmaea TaxID=425635 RepID=A0A8C3KD02_9CHAR